MNSCTNWTSASCISRCNGWAGQRLDSPSEEAHARSPASCGEGRTLVTGTLSSARPSTRHIRSRRERDLGSDAGREPLDAAIPLANVLDSPSLAPGRSGSGPARSPQLVPTTGRNGPKIGFIMCQQSPRMCDPFISEAPRSPIDGGK
jgi:hypothetical protein